MSTPFTINASNWQEKAEELRLALSERNKFRYAGGFWEKFEWWLGSQWRWLNGSGDNTDKLPDEANLQAYSFWNGQQEEIEDMLDQYTEYEEGFTHDGLSASESDALRFNSFAEFCEYVGSPLWESSADYGWPRSNSLDAEGNPVMQRGRFEVGDYIGPWIIESIVSSYESLVASGKDSTATRFSVPAGGTVVYIGRGATQQESLENARNATGSPTTAVNTSVGSTVFFNNPPAGEEWVCILTRYSLYLNEVPNVSLIELYDGSDLKYFGAFRDTFLWSEQPEGTLISMSQCRLISDFTNA